MKILLGLSSHVIPLILLNVQFWSTKNSQYCKQYHAQYTTLITIHTSRVLQFQTRSFVKN
jgi:hypothetical protein